jgi:hypothetical protein
MSEVERYSQIRKQSKSELDGSKAKQDLESQKERKKEAEGNRAHTCVRHPLCTMATLRLYLLTVLM